MYAMHAVGDERTAGLAQDECGQALQVEVFDVSAMERQPLNHPVAQAYRGQLQLLHLPVAVMLQAGSHLGHSCAAV
eukprot:4105-Heterococcus_DN1.PRE.3